MSKEPTLCLSRRRGIHTCIGFHVCLRVRDATRADGPRMWNRRKAVLKPGLSLAPPTIAICSRHGLSCLSAVCIDRVIYLHYRL